MIEEINIQEACTNETLKVIAKKLNFARHLKENPCQAGQEPKTRPASAVEAIIGSIWVDCNRDLMEMQKVIKSLQG